MALSTEQDRKKAQAEINSRMKFLTLPIPQFISEAKKLDAQLWLSEDKVGPLQKSEIAITLLAMLSELEERLTNAPKDSH